MITVSIGITTKETDGKIIEHKYLSEKNLVECNENEKWQEKTIFYQGEKFGIPVLKKNCKKATRYLKLRRKKYPG